MEETSSLKGLDAAQAAERLISDGPNELAASQGRGILRIVFEVLREPMLALLLAAGFIYMLLGDLREALILLSFAGLSVLITVVQESRTEKVLAALRDLSSPRAQVIREGRVLRIAGREVVRGDLLMLAEGERVAADARLLQAHDLQADESLLTGESVPVRKRAAEASASLTPRPGGDDLPHVYAGTLVVRGQGLAEVTATGPRSEMGRIGQSLQSLEVAAPHLQQQTRRLVLAFAAVGALVSLLVVVLYGLLRGDWLQALLAGIAVGMSMLPEEFPVVLTVFMAMGAWRISRGRVLTRRASAIETLGSATVLCSDKTGTLTENRMTLVELRLPGGVTLRLDQPDAAPDDAALELIRIGALACAREPFDPMERAFHDAARVRLGEGWAMPQAQALRHSYGLRPELLAMSQVWQLSVDPNLSGEPQLSGDPQLPGDPQRLRIASKGAPEAIASLCALDEAALAALRIALADMAERGLRVLGVAQAHWPDDVSQPLPASQQGLPLRFMGLVGLLDPIRASVPPAVQQCRDAGIRVIMITGDHPATARAIARQAGIAEGDLVSGPELAAMDDATLASRVRSVTVFARILPEQKLRIVQALKAQGEVVAMTGDGVNDAPSLKAADIGVAMGGRGTDVAREASAIVLLDDDFGAIVRTIRLGRRIYDNLRKAMGFILAVHVPIAGLALLPLLMGSPILLGPVHIAFLEMVIDPVCSLVFEAEPDEDDVMQRPPRAPAEALFPGAMIGASLLQGLLALVMVGTIHVFGQWRGMPEGDLRALSFFCLVTAIVVLIFVNRSARRSPWALLRHPGLALGVIVPTIAVLLGATLLWPLARELFRFGPLHGDDLSLVLASGVGLYLVLEALRYGRSRLAARRSRQSRAL